MLGVAREEKEKSCEEGVGEGQGEEEKEEEAGSKDRSIDEDGDRISYSRGAIDMVK